MRPLDRIPSIKIKLGIILVAAAAGTTLAIVIGVRTGLNRAVAAVVAGAVGLLAIQLLARGMTSPLREMAAAARSMAKGEYGTRITASSQDEVGELARAFNTMAAELEQVDRMRRDLVANVSHELRTPLTALQAQLENMIDGIEPGDAQTLSMMLVQVHRLNRLVEQLLDLSKLESGATPLVIEEFDIRSIVDQAVREAQLDLRRRGSGNVSIEINIEPEGLIGHGDPERVHQIVANLLDNALRHSPEEGTVNISARSRDGAVVLAITDEGPGIVSEDAERVFERFYRSDSSRSSDDGGSGLGLAIVRWIVDLHGGEILVERNGTRGARMVVSLPAGRA